MDETTTTAKPDELEAASVPAPTDAIVDAWVRDTVLAHPGLHVDLWNLLAAAAGELKARLRAQE